MNKLEQLKALMTAERDMALSWMSSANSEASDNSVKPTWRKFREARMARRILSDELLPPLIAVAEAAIAVSKQTPSRPDYWSSCGQCDSNSQEFEGLLEPLIKGTDK